MMKILRVPFAFIILGLTFSSGLAQDLTQTVRGKVVDEDSQYPLIGVNVILTSAEDSTYGTVTDENGQYRLRNIPVGRHRIKFSYLGYQERVVQDVVLTSGKELILNVSLQEAVQDLETVRVTATKNGEPRNEMAMVSAREFSVSETDRYAGSRGEPARMASNFAGVQGADDSRNDIVIRGNSPRGVIYKLEGINIPNPNHFAIPGTAGGPVTILNNKFLANSDFFTGAFPAEYGNGLAGVFDLKMRNGNNEEHEFSGQLGFLGTELSAEGPLNNSGASYLATYRYSTLRLFESLNIQIGTDAVPRYQDASFRLNFPLKNGAQLSAWGIGGVSDIDIVLSDQEAPSEETLLYGSNDRDQYFSSRMGVAGLSYTQPIDRNTFVKATLGVSNQNIDANHDFIYRRVVDNRFVVDSLPSLLDYEFNESRYTASVFVNKKLNRNSTLKIGLQSEMYDLFYIDSARNVIVGEGGEPTRLGNWRTRWDANRIPLLLQPHIQWKWRPSSDWTLTAGATALYYSLNEHSFSPFEPRLGLSYQLSPSQKLSFGAGLHSQIQPNYIYFYGEETANGDPIEQNENIGLSKSIHAVTGYDWAFHSDMRLKVEAYYQYLYDIPVTESRSSFSLLNAGTGFSRFFPGDLVNGGIGRNYGLEFTLEKFFSKGYFFLLTASVFDAQYQGSDGIWRNTTFNGNYAMNGLFTRSFKIGQQLVFNAGTNITFAGGRWYGPVDEDASREALEIIYEDETVNSRQFDPYFRMDLRLDLRWNRPKVSHEFAIDLINIFNVENILTLTYAPEHPSGNPIREEYQLGFLPIFYYKIDF